MYMYRTDKGVLGAKRVNLKLTHAVTWVVAVVVECPVFMDFPKALKRSAMTPLLKIEYRTSNGVRHTLHVLSMSASFV